MFEQWRDIPGYEGHYQASTYGRVRSSPGRLVKNKGTCGDKIRNAWVLTPILGKDGRERMTLSKDCVIRTHLLSRLVAITWVAGYKDGLTVNHINGDKRDNNIANLEWVTRGDNIRYGYEHGQYKEKQTSATIIYTTTGKEIACASLAEASRLLGMANGYVSNYIKKHSPRLLGTTVNLLHLGVLVRLGGD